MLRKKIVMVFSLVFFLSVIELLGIGTQNITAQEEIFDDELDTQVPQEVFMEESTEELGSFDVDKAIDIILEDGSTSFFAGYPVDEAFVCWICSEYGSGVVCDIAYQVYQGNFDTSIWSDYTGESMHVLWLDYCKTFNFNTYNLQDVIWLEDDDDTTTLDFVGDIVFADNWQTMEYASTKSDVLDCFSDGIKEELQSADLTVANNEYTLADKGTALEGKAYTFRGKASNAKYLKELGIDIVSLANNHVFDYGQEGLFSTMNALQNENIQMVGAGRNIDEASAIRYYVDNGKKIAIVSATQIERFSNFTKEATEDSPGVLKTVDPERFCNVIKEAKSKSDYVVAFVHWGTEGTDFYDSSQESLAQAFVDAGADAIIGGHPHRMQGAQFIDGVPVVYSLGNFWLSSGSLYTTVAQINVDSEGKLTVKMIPCMQDSLEVSLLEDSQKGDFYNYLTECSKNLAIGEDGTLIDINATEGYEVSDVSYIAGANFKVHTSNLDLKGREIDSIGNLK